MKKISLFLVLVLIISLCGCTFASHKEESTSQLTGEDLAIYTSLIKSRIDSKSFLRFDMKLDAYDSIKSYVFKVINGIEEKNMPFYFSFSKNRAEKTFRFCLSYEEAPVSDIIDDFSLDNNFSPTEIVIIPNNQTGFDESSILDQLDIWGTNISFNQNQFEVSECTYFTINFEE